MNGKKVFNRFARDVAITNTSYQLDLHNLVSGVYLLEVSNGKEISRAKFVLVRN